MNAGRGRGCGRRRGRGQASPGLGSPNLNPNRASSPTPTAGPWVCRTSWGPLLMVVASGFPTGGPSPSQGHGRGRPSNSTGVLGPSTAPALAQAYTTFAPTQFSTYSLGPQWSTSGLVAALDTMQNPTYDWVMDTGALFHMASDEGILHSSHPPTHPLSITMGNSATLPITRVGNTSLPTPSSNFFLHNILLVPSIVRNLISIHHFTIDNSVYVEFDPFGFSIKDLHTRTTILCWHFLQRMASLSWPPQ